MDAIYQIPGPHQAPGASAEWEAPDATRFEFGADPESRIWPMDVDTSGMEITPLAQTMATMRRVKIVTETSAAIREFRVPVDGRDIPILEAPLVNREVLTLDALHRRARYRNARQQCPMWAD